MIDDDKRLFEKLGDATNPRTPLHFKRLFHLTNRPDEFMFRYGESTFYRSAAFICGVSYRAAKPISKMFTADDE